MTALKWTGVIVGSTAALFAFAAVFFSQVVNPAMIKEIRNNPAGEEAAEAMLLTIGDRTLPVNYLKEGDTVFIGVDGPWWRNFEAGVLPVSMLIKGETYKGQGVLSTSEAYRDEIFARLRPTEPAWLPDWLRGKLVVITID